MQQTPVSFNCGELSLHGYVYYPDVKACHPAVILCHPHPLHGGSMNNNVIREVGNALVNKNMVAMMFNFRGVGKSTGKFGRGIAEQNDVIAALDWIITQAHIDFNKIGLCGYSFGGGVAAPVGCSDSRIKAIALISPAIETSNAAYLQTCTKPKYFITGTGDDMIPVDTVALLYQESGKPKELELIPQADHFWSKYEKILGKNIAAFFQKQFHELKTEKNC